MLLILLLALAPSTTPISNLLGACNKKDKDFTTLIPSRIARLGSAVTATEVFKYAASNTPVILENGIMERNGLGDGLRKFLGKRKITSNGRGRFFERLRGAEKGNLAQLAWPWKDDAIEWSLNFVFGGTVDAQVQGDDANEEQDDLNVKTTLATLGGGTQQVSGMHCDAHFELLAAAQVIGRKRWHIIAPAATTTAYGTGEFMAHWAAATTTIPPNLAVPLKMQNSSRLYEDDVNEGEILIWPGWLPHGTTAIADGSLSVNGRLHPKTTGDADALVRIVCGGSIPPMIRDNEEACCGYIASIGVWSPACD
jgi:hypothetical protein